MMRQRRIFLRLTTTAAGIALLLAACGSNGEDATTTTTTATTTTTTTTTTTEPPSTVATTEPTTTTSTTTTEAPSTTAPWRGEEATLFAQPGDVLGVVGVADDDVLNVRAGPGTEHEIVATLDPLASAVATGRTWQLPDSFWYELDVDGTIGWSNISFLAYLGGVDDATSIVVADVGAIPSAETMDELGLIVTESFVSEEPASRVVRTVAPSSGGDLAEVTYDVIGIGDDAVLGFRLHVFGQPGDGDGFGLKSVERTVLCGRGLSGELCV